MTHGSKVMFSSALMTSHRPPVSIHDIQDQAGDLNFEHDGMIANWEVFHDQF